MNKELFKIAIQAMRANPLRTLLTTLGIIIGTGIVVIVLSVGAGIEALILDQLNTFKPETLFVEVRVPSQGTQAEIDTNTGQNLATGAIITTMTVEDAEDMREHFNIDYVYAMTFAQGSLTYRSESLFPTIWAVQEDFAIIEKFELDAGRFFTDKEDNAFAPVIVLGSQAADDLFGNEDPIGKRVKLEGNNYEVIGVATPIGSKWFLDADNAVYMPVQTVQKKILGIDYVLGIGMEMHDPELIHQTIDDLERVMRYNHNIQDPAKDDFVFRTQEQAINIVNDVTTGISALLFAIAAISLIVGGVGIMNIMYVAVSERTQEIGLRKAVGANPSVIRRQFIYEAIMVTLLGGILGVIAGVLVTWLVSTIANALGFDWPFVVPIIGLFLAFASSTVIGIVFGYAPASKAADLDPILALRRS